MIEVRPRSLRGVERTHGRLRQALLSAPTLVSVLLAASVIARILMARHVLAPWAMGDELRHSELANSFVATRHYVLREQPYHLPSIYPALISPAWLADSMKTTYALAKGFNVALMTAAAIPLYAWARRLVRPAYAILAVGVYLAIPSFVYTAELLTENAYVPAVVLALLVLALALERPTIPRQLLALALAALVVAIRVQGIVFAAIIPTAIGLKVLFDLRAAAPASKRAVLRQTASRWSLPLGLLVLAAVVYAAYEQLRGASLSSGLGIYSAIAHSHYTLQDSARWVTYHFGELAFSVGAIPFSALVLLVGLAFTPTGTPRPVERAFVAVAAASVSGPSSRQASTRPSSSSGSRSATWSTSCRCCCSRSSSGSIAACRALRAWPPLLRSCRSPYSWLSRTRASSEPGSTTARSASSRWWS